MRTDTVEITELETIRGIAVPRGVRFRQIIVTGPPCSGKTTLVTGLHGWPEEGYLDLTQKRWWRDRILTYRPREVHCGFAFANHRESLSPFDEEWLADPTPLALDRLKIPPRKKHFFQIDWRNRYVFDIQLPSPRLLFDIRAQRAKAGTHPVDERVLSLEQVERQVAVYWAFARHFHACGLRVHVRTKLGGPPRRIVSSSED